MQDKSAAANLELHLEVKNVAWELLLLVVATASHFEKAGKKSLCHLAWSNGRPRITDGVLTQAVLQLCCRHILPEGAHPVSAARWTSSNQSLADSTDWKSVFRQHMLAHNVAKPLTVLVLELRKITLKSCFLVGGAEDPMHNLSVVLDPKP